MDGSLGESIQSETLFDPSGFGIYENSGDRSIDVPRPCGGTAAKLITCDTKDKRDVGASLAFQIYWQDRFVSEGAVS